MREPTRRAKIFAAAAQRARLTRRAAAPVSQRSEERWVLFDIEGPDLNTSAVTPRTLSSAQGRNYRRPSARSSAARAVDSVYSAATRCAPALAAPTSASESSMMLPTPAL